MHDLPVYVRAVRNKQLGNILPRKPLPIHTIHFHCFPCSTKL